MRVAVVFALLATAAGAQGLDPGKASDALLIARKMQCSTVDGEAAVYHWSGRVYSRLEGERDRHLFDVEGMNVRQCGRAGDVKLGEGYRMVSREIMLYLDPVTKQPLRRWANPFTGAEVEVVHVANDPVNMRPNFPVSAEGKPYSVPVRFEGAHAYWSTEVPLFYTNPLGGDFQAAAGNHYHAMEIFDFFDDAAAVRDPKRTQTYPRVAWVRVAPWLPWMEMGSRPGLMVFNATGGKLRRFADLPAVLKSEIAARYPAYTAPPPLDDARPNETSWTYYRKLKGASPAP